MEKSKKLWNNRGSGYKKREQSIGRRCYLMVFSESIMMLDNLLVSR